MHRICWVMALGGCLLAGCGSHKQSDLPAEISGVWTEGRPDSMIYLNISGHDKTFATAANPGIIYSASISAVDPDNRTVTVNVGVPENSGKEAENQQYVFREVGDGKGQPQHLVMTGPTGYQASLSFVRKLTNSEIAEQPTHYAAEVASGQPTAAPPAPAAPPNTAPPAPATPPAAAPQPAPKITVTPAPQSAPKVAVAPTQAPTPQPAPPPKLTPAPAAPETQGAAPGAENSAAAASGETALPENQTEPAPKQNEPAPEKAAPGTQGVIAQARAAGCNQDNANARYDCVSQKYNALNHRLTQAYSHKLASASADERAALAHDKYRWDIHRKETCRDKSYAVPGGPDRKTSVLLCWTQWTRQRLATLGKGAASNQ